MFSWEFQYGLPNSGRTRERMIDAAILFRHIPQ